MSDIVRLAPRRAWVLADLHLSAEEPEGIGAFSEQMKNAPALDLLLILGDLFDAWVGPGQLQDPDYEPVFHALRERSEAGTAVVLLRGNRDALFGESEARALGITVADTALLDLHGGIRLADHGDRFCTADLAYQRLRRTLRRPWVRALLRGLPYRLARALGRRLRGHSRAAVARKPLDAMLLNEAAVASALEEAGAVGAVLGHLHRRRDDTLPGGGGLLVLPAWEEGVEPLEICDGCLSSAAPS